MRIRQLYMLILTLLLLGGGALVAGSCDDDDDDDDDSQNGADKDYQSFCERVTACELYKYIQFSTWEECLSLAAAAEATLRECVLAAVDCETMAACFPQAADDDDDDNDDDDNDDDNDTTPPDAFSCEDLGYPVRDFQDVEDDATLNALAADFTVQTDQGPWTLSDHWTGCESYLFILDDSRQAAGWAYDLWERDVAKLLYTMPGNVHLFFMSPETETAEIETALDLVRGQIDEYLEERTEEEQAHWFHHVHYVTEPAKEIPGWLGEINTSPRWGAAIDRAQRVRYIGSYADPMRYDSGEEWFAPNLSMAANEAIYYNFEAERADRLAAQGATVVAAFDNVLLEDPGWAGVRGEATITFPDAATMAGFDTLEIDLTLGCHGEGEYGTCPAWDYIATLYLCDQDDPEQCETEMGRWITTYHREGRWVHDISPLLPLIAAGGERKIEFYTQQPYDVTMTFRLSAQGKAKQAEQAVFLFAGGSFNPDYNGNYEPAPVDIPADATRVELATVITGHGMASPGNCAEFCNTTHHFFVNGTENILEFPLAGGIDDCQEQVVEGTVPNQYGTWWYGRSGWCPGKEVQMIRTDVTSQVTPGQTATITYQGYDNGAAYPSEGASIVMSSWAVIYR